MILACIQHPPGLGKCFSGASLLVMLVRHLILRQHLITVSSLITLIIKCQEGTCLANQLQIRYPLKWEYMALESVFLLLAHSMS